MINNLWDKQGDWESKSCEYCNKTDHKSSGYKSDQDQINLKNGAALYKCKEESKATTQYIFYRNHY